jgi:hypothetical protein
MFNEKNEIMGDLLDEIAEAELDFPDPEPEVDPADDAEMEAHFQDWLRRNVDPDELAAAQSIREWDWNERDWPE